MCEKLDVKSKKFWELINESRNMFIHTPDDISGIGHIDEGPLMKELRNEMGILQKDMAEYLEIAPSSLAVHEKRAIVNKKTMGKFCKRVEISYTDFSNLKLVLEILNTDLETLVNNPNLLTTQKEILNKKKELEKEEKARTIVTINKIMDSISIECLRELLDYSETIRLKDWVIKQPGVKDMKITGDKIYINVTPTNTDKPD